ncbi:uncharacterized protein E5676_scaffold602G00210 [Cucumis melo var. makuwa]|uniref:Uncharacterized protein n=1 Tax=Cucumis melo var. makuwa TaxID=1194695 RepID=A0A5A7VM80_CUCMM|nr:uncharacterized protein E6C27_scaffold21G004990 [Cucumis melo var. makuwa]TYK00866.1 uncharacterized protein E5676_scaffold602G00210 [Cucumis melo var. makuwa]
MQEVERRNAQGQGQVEKRVETVDYRSSVGQGLEKRNVQVVHVPHSSSENFATSGGVLAGAAAAVANTLQSAKEAISRK